MKNTTLLLSLIVIVTLFNSCKKNDVQPQLNLIQNGDMEASPWNDWGFGFGSNLNSNPNNYTTEYTTEAASSPTHSIKLKCDAVKNDTTFSYLYQRLLGGTISTGAKLTLKIKIKTVNVQGNGISVAMRGDNIAAGKSTFFTTTQGTTVISGSSDAFTEYTVRLDSFPANTDYLYIFLVFLPKTTGTAYMDDASLIVN
ncbi:hypothetical protein WBJ53_11405 [Spirosoma sp. SC4-14]|uniref:hypothetical protein n=1 Tax=Spirosoma sp. SC4-14 TaxID=3128900 RepID=UPI0030D0A83F